MDLKCTITFCIKDVTGDVIMLVNNFKKDNIKLLPLHEIEGATNY